MKPAKREVIKALIIATAFFYAGYLAAAYTAFGLMPLYGYASFYILSPALFVLNPLGSILSAYWPNLIPTGYFILGAIWSLFLAYFIVWYWPRGKYRWGIVATLIIIMVFVGLGYLATGHALSCTSVPGCIFFSALAYVLNPLGFAIVRLGRLHREMTYFILGAIWSVFLATAIVQCWFWYRNRKKSG